MWLLHVDCTAYRYAVTWPQLFVYHGDDIVSQSYEQFNLWKKYPSGEGVCEEAVYHLALHHTASICQRDILHRNVG